MYKCLNDIGPSYLKELVEFKTYDHGYRLRSQLNKPLDNPARRFYSEKLLITDHVLFSMMKC